ncbi:Sec63 Brl domain-containing protein [Pisolithus croceorrhizus]|nr:Sec63 Brl domain-containing protein [Pisolithus croceorrhizus]
MDILLLPIDANSNYYNLHNVSNQHLSDHLSELVENILQGLTNLKYDEMDVSVPNRCNGEVYLLSLQEHTKLKGLLEVVSSLAEFEVIPIRWHEDIVLCQIYDCMLIKLNHPGFEAPHFKTFLLLQAYFSHIQLLASLNMDQVLLSACMDVRSSNAWLGAKCVYRHWCRKRPPPLKQIPHFDSEVFNCHTYPLVTNCCEEAGVEPAYEIMEMEDDKCNALLQINVWQMRDVAMSVSSNLTLDVSYELIKDEYTADVPISTGVSLAQGTSEGDPNHDQTIVVPFYPLKKMENWWLVVGQPSTCQLHVMFNIKHVIVSKSCP